MHGRTHGSHAGAGAGGSHPPRQLVLAAPDSHGGALGDAGHRDRCLHHRGHHPSGARGGELGAERRLPGRDVHRRRVADLAGRPQRLAQRVSGRRRRARRAHPRDPAPADGGTLRRAPRIAVGAAQGAARAAGHLGGDPLRAALQARHRGHGADDPAVLGGPRVHPRGDRRGADHRADPGDGGGSGAWGAF